jgi:histidine triad (HIT) family protein
MAIVSDGTDPPAPPLRRQDDCLFCRIAAGEVAARVARSSPRAVAFHDVNPQAPTHVLVVPRDHHRDVASAVAADPDLVAHLVAEAAAVAQESGLGSGWRLVANTGPAGGQTVGHVHLHVLGGRDMRWPPG